MVSDVIKEAGLQLPEASGYVTQGVLGIHTEHMSYLLAEMQSLARQHPGAQW
jgi:ring-1,2-phenylacetyl-CoA epoxidase subunit PaaC